jgi:hypothetical protein
MGKKKYAKYFKGLNSGWEGKIPPPRYALPVIARSAATKQSIRFK